MRASQTSVCRALSGRVIILIRSDRRLGKCYRRTEKIVFHFRVVRDVSCVGSCVREMCLQIRGVFGSRVLLLLLLLLLAVVPLASRSFSVRFPHFSFVPFSILFIFSFSPLSTAFESRLWPRASLTQPPCHPEKAGYMARSMHLCPTNKVSTSLRRLSHGKFVGETDESASDFFVCDMV